MAFQLIVMYHHPEDVSAFDEHYDSVHAPIAARLPGLRSYTVMRPAPVRGERPPYHLIAVLTFDDEDAYNAGMAGEEGKAAVADLANFAGAGVTMVTGPANAVV